MCTPSRRSSMRIVTSAYEAASGTTFAISFMMSGLPTTKRSILGPWLPRSFAQRVAGIEPPELHQIRRSDRLSHDCLEFAQRRRRGHRIVKRLRIWPADRRRQPSDDLVEWSLRHHAESLYLDIDGWHVLPPRSGSTRPS